ncbi:hypothetical protein CSV67_03000 [Sporosarcina sp. P2]|uniref:NUMOD3 domain-containing DNA-binding protein n=1 Tax=Sporosarcina sp. P2 TaxID=2048251 RepID=UPI000C1689BA|nr:NUMOD3 domain-containing DNA-binding protein [Sporosarcina sp. P2]PID03625.1 hypothetical protein CSV67_03000 [Sporosarcina sp. P2]
MFDFTPIEEELKIKIEALDMKIVYLYYLEKYSIREVSRELGCSTHVVKDALVYGVRSKKEACALRSTEEFKAKMSKINTGEKHPKAKLTESDVIAIRDKFSELFNLGIYTKAHIYRGLAAEYDVKIPTILSIIQRRNWKHI